MHGLLGLGLQDFGRHGYLVAPDGDAVFLDCLHECRKHQLFRDGKDVGRYLLVERTETERLVQERDYLQVRHADNIAFHLQDVEIFEQLQELVGLGKFRVVEHEHLFMEFGKRYVVRTAGVKVLAEQEEQCGERLHDLALLQVVFGDVAVVREERERGLEPARLEFEFALECRLFDENDFAVLCRAEGVFPGLALEQAEFPDDRTWPEVTPVPLAQLLGHAYKHSGLHDDEACALVAFEEQVFAFLDEHQTAPLRLES